MKTSVTKLAGAMALGPTIVAPALAEKIDLIGTAGAWSFHERKKDCLTETKLADDTPCVEVAMLDLTDSDKAVKAMLAFQEAP